MDDIRTALKRQGRKRAKARDDLAATSLNLADIAPQAIAAGLTKVEICELAQISRPALDAMLKG